MPVEYLALNFKRNIPKRSTGSERAIDYWMKPLETLCQEYAGVELSSQTDYFQYEEDLEPMSLIKIYLVGVCSVKNTVHLGEGYRETEVIGLSQNIDERLVQALDGMYKGHTFKKIEK